VIDLHCHLLPEVDDGASSIEASIELLNIAINDGIKHMVFTPHMYPTRYNNTQSSLVKSFDIFQKHLAKQQLDITISLGAEVRLCSEILDLYSKNQLSYIGRWQDKKVILLEFPHNAIPPGSENLISWLLDKNIIPMIAHPERNKAIMNDINKLTPFIELGCLFQLTAMSVTGAFGKGAYTIAHTFLRNNWAHVIASDAHNSLHRPPILSKAYQFVVENYSEQLAQELFSANPHYIISH
jgi:protein-tyrosine phosphatase